MSEVIKIKKINEVYFQLEFDDYGTALELKEYFSFYIPNHRYNPKVKARLWDGKISMYDREYSTLPIGLLTKLIKFCKKFKYEYTFEFNVSEFINEVSYEEVKKHCYEVTKELGFDPYDYQVEAVHKSIQNKRGIVLSPTGSGKSLIIYCIIRWILKENKRILLVVPNIS
ncbi:MAG: DEAD/DEAH box helicase family protein, partial [Flavobacteriales bacterium]|nr:DEAD/DEAH box helicase family protein [Flavobacteriales bacterium]